jgi:hypothetical protein
MRPCPDCGHTVSLKDLRAKLDEAKEKKRRRENEARRRRTHIAPNGGITLDANTGSLVVDSDDVTIWHVGHVDVADPYEVCAKCGRVWRSDFAEEADRLKSEIIEVQGIVDSLADLAEENPSPNCELRMRSRNDSRT